MNTRNILTAYDQLYAIRSELDPDQWRAIIAHIDSLDITEIPTITPVRADKPAPAPTVPVEQPTPAVKPAPIAKIITEQPAPKPKTTTPKPAPTGEGKFLCEVCSARFAAGQKFGQHMKTEHWDDIVDEYELNGAAGLQRTLGISGPTAWRWGKTIEQAAA